MAQQPWRDVCSDNLWASTMRIHKRGGPLNIFIDGVMFDLRAYHIIKKADLDLFDLRKGLLRKIENKVKLFLASNDGLKAPDNFRRHSELLQHQAKLKAEYLDKIKAFYLPEGASNRFLDPVEFINFLKSPHVAPMGGAKLQPGARMEALDPFHRAFEMHFEDNKLTLDCFYNPMEAVFGEWIGAIASQGTDIWAELVNADALTNLNPVSHPALNTPFFVWMEKHLCCVGQDHDGFLSTDGSVYPTEINSVIYSPYGSGQQAGPIQAVDEIHWLMPSSDGLVMEFPLAGNNSKKLRIFDTQHLKGKAPYESQSAAYVWTTCGTLLAGEHKPNHLHHSSFVGGADVRCAGMIKVVCGKVEIISNNSGHYKPSAGNLKEFAQWLNGRNVFHAQSKAIYHGSPPDGENISEFLNSPVIGNKTEGNTHVVEDLVNLARSMESVVQRYENSRTKGGLFSHNSFFRSKSEESQKVLNYLKNEFRQDIETAKLDINDPKWCGFPTEVIRTLLSKNGALPFHKLLKRVDGRPVIGNRKFSSLAGLVPLKIPSTMHTILSDEFNKLS